jgi:hypothetical protein
MTAPMLFGTCMTFHWLIVHKLKPRALRKWVGLTFFGFGVATFFPPFGLSATHSLVALALTFTGFDLLFGRDHSRPEEDCP